jgi:hypothetical protein
LLVPEAIKASVSAGLAGTISPTGPAWLLAVRLQRLDARLRVVPAREAAKAKPQKLLRRRAVLVDKAHWRNSVKSVMNLMGP